MIAGVVFGWWARKCGCILVVLAVGVLYGLPAEAQAPVRVGVYANAPKVDVAADGTPSGIYVDVMRSVAARDGLVLQFVPGTFQQGLDRLQRGEIDLLVDVARSPEREARFDFNREPVLLSWSQVWAARGSGIRAIPDLAGKRVAVLQGSVQERFLRDAAAAFRVTAQLQPYPTFDSAYAAVREGRADAVLGNVYGRRSARGLHDTGIVFGMTGLHFAATRGRHEALLAAIDRELLQAKADPNSAYARTVHDLIGEQQGTRVPRWLIPALVASCAAMVLALGWVYSARRMAARLRRAEQKLRRRLAVSRRRGRALAAANEDLRLISFSLSHDLRQPVAAIRGFVGAVLRADSVPAGSRELHLLTRADAAATRLDTMVRDLAALLKVAGAPLHREACDLTRLARDVVQELHVEAAAPAQLQIAEGLQVRGDERLLRIVLENLLGNALKFSARMAAPRIEVGCLAGEEAVYFVRDNGAGFDMAYAGNLFQPFTRLHDFNDFPGSGLGLSIVRRAVSKHGGRVWIESTPGVGTSVYFTLAEPPAARTD